MGNIFQGQPVKGSEASVSLLQGSIMCPYYGGIRDRRSDHGSVNPLSNVRAGAPVATCGGQQSIEKALSLGGLGEDVIMPPHPAIECESQVLSIQAVRDGMTRDGESSGRNCSGAGEEDNLGYHEIEGESAVHTPVD